MTGLEIRESVDQTWFKDSDLKTKPLSEVLVSPRTKMREEFREDVM